MRAEAHASRNTILINPKIPTFSLYVIRNNNTRVVYTHARSCLYIFIRLTTEVYKFFLPRPLFAYYNMLYISVVHAQYTHTAKSLPRAQTHTHTHTHADRSRADDVTNGALYVYYYYTYTRNTRGSRVRSGFI